jgi:voltage-gated potassium channel
MTEPTVRQKLYRIIFKSDTRAGNLFDIIVIWLIILSVIFVVIDSIRSIHSKYSSILNLLHWIFTILFTIEYLLRLYASPVRRKYAMSFFGIVDLLSILPSYYGIFFTGTKHLLIVRILRLLRIFRIFEMKHFVKEGAVVASALRASRTKITVFLSFVLIASVLMGAIMYMVEANHNPQIQNIADGIYWAIVTLTTVGYGDTIPITHAGKFIASIVMILGYGVIAVPTGIVTAEISSRVLGPQGKLKIKCKNCGDHDHLQNSFYCHTCGSSLAPEKEA